MPLVRDAAPGDAHPLTILHVEAGLGQPVNRAWLNTHSATLAQQLRDRDPALLACVIDTPDHSGLASAAVGYIHHTLSRPGRPTGRSAHICSVTTLSAYRGRGYATAAVAALLRRASARGCDPISLYARPGTADLYQRLGFTESTTLYPRWISSPSVLTAKR